MAAIDASHSTAPIPRNAVEVKRWRVAALSRLAPAAMRPFNLPGGSSSD
jgi:hypothetical protein